MIEFFNKSNDELTLNHHEELTQRLFMMTEIDEMF